MTQQNGNGLSSEQWRMVMRRVRWMQLLLSLVASLIAFSAVSGFWASDIYNRIATNQSSISRIEDTVDMHRAKLASIQANQSKADTATARLEERLEAQSASLDRIESMLERLTADVYGRPR